MEGGLTAGFGAKFSGLLHGLDWETTGRLASLLGAIKIESRGPQNHEFTRAELRARYQQNFGHVPEGI